MNRRHFFGLLAALITMGVVKKPRTIHHCTIDELIAAHREYLRKADLPADAPISARQLFGTDTFSLR